MLHELFLFYAAASFTTLFLYGVVLVFLLIGVYADSIESNTSFKWWSLAVLYGLYVTNNFGSITVHSTVTTIFNKDTLLTALEYLGIGLIYSLIEFRFTIKDASGYFVNLARNFQADYDEREKLNDKRYINPTFSKSITFIDAEYDALDKKISTKIVTRKLTDYLSAWAVLWPFYAINMLIGRFVAEFFSVFAEYVKKVFGGHINKIFNAKLESFKDE